MAPLETSHLGNGPADGGDQTPPASPLVERLLADHRAAFLASTNEVSAVAESNRELLEASYRAVKETLSGFGAQDDTATTYTPSGSAPPAQRRHLFDRAL